jgi:hypothetical protein
VREGIWDAMAHLNVFERPDKFVKIIDSDVANLRQMYSYRADVTESYLSSGSEGHVFISSTIPGYIVEIMQYMMRQRGRFLASGNKYNDVIIFVSVSSLKSVCKI